MQLVFKKFVNVDCFNDYSVYRELSKFTFNVNYNVTIATNKLGNVILNRVDNI